MQADIRFNQTSKPVNLDCRCGVILEYIRKLAEIDRSYRLDVCDKDGNVRRLNESLTSYASNLLESGETYFLVNVIDDSKDPNIASYALLVELGRDEPKIEPKAVKPEKREPYKKLTAKSAARTRRLAHKPTG